MTTPKLLTAPGKGHGLTDAITDPIYRALAQNQPTTEIVAVVILRPKSFGATDTADGRHQHVSFEAARVEPVADANQAAELRYLIQGLYEQRTSVGEQRMLPLGLGSDQEKQLALLERIEDWSKAEGQTGGQLEALWRDHFGIGGDQDWSMGDQGIPGDYRKAGVQRLLEFGYAVGALDSGDRLPHEDRDDEDEDDEALTSPVPGNGTSDEGEEPDTVACEVCSAQGVRLSDGLCDGCSANAGVPVEKVTEAVS